MTDKNTKPEIWANLLHLSYNMWSDRDSEAWPAGSDTIYHPQLHFDRGVWSDLLQHMAQAKMNMVVIDLGDAVQYQSHPEIAVKNAWSPDELRAELARLRGMGLEPIPKLNFSTAHDLWMGDYARMVSTKKYYEVCRNLIAEVIQLFDTPRFFHLGMDEETAAHQEHYAYAVMRQHELWWHDLFLLLGAVEKGGVQPWIWSDYVWHHPEEFYRQMPKSVLQSNWYYGADFAQFAEGDLQKTYVQAYCGLEEHGYDQVPTGSNWSTPLNFERTVEFCRRHIAPERLLGFMTAPWHPTLPDWRQKHGEAIEQVEGAMLIGGKSK